MSSVPCGMGKRGDGIDTSSFYSSIYARDRSKVKVWEPACGCFHRCPGPPAFLRSDHERLLHCPLVDGLSRVQPSRTTALHQLPC